MRPCSAKPRGQTEGGHTCSFSRSAPMVRRRLKNDMGQAWPVQAISNQSGTCFLLREHGTARRWLTHGTQASLQPATRFPLPRHISIDFDSRRREQEDCGVHRLRHSASQPARRISSHFPIMEYTPLIENPPPHCPGALTLIEELWNCCHFPDAVDRHLGPILLQYWVMSCFVHSNRPSILSSPSPSGTARRQLCC